MKLVFFGTSNVALPVLERLARHHEIAAVVTTPDAVVGRKREIAPSPVSVMAEELQVKILKPENLRRNDLFRLELEGLKADLYAVVSYGKIIPREILDIPPYGALNVHFSRLPKYRGASPIQAALLNGDTETATSIMVLDEELDHGPVVTAQKHPIDPDDNYITLSQKLAYVSAHLLVNAIPDFTNGYLKPVEQDHSKATYTKIISKQDGKIDWSKTSREIYNQFRAYYPWPGIWTTWNGKMLKISDCIPSLLTDQGSVPGSVLPTGIVVCGQGTCLSLHRLQLEGKSDVGIAEFLNGYQKFVGSKLG